MHLWEREKERDEHLLQIWSGYCPLPPVESWALTRGQGMFEADQVQDSNCGCHVRARFSLPVHLPLYCRARPQILFAVYTILYERMNACEWERGAMSHWNPFPQPSSSLDSGVRTSVERGSTHLLAECVWAVSRTAVFPFHFIGTRLICLMLVW